MENLQEKFQTLEELAQNFFYKKNGIGLKSKKIATTVRFKMRENIRSILFNMDELNDVLATDQRIKLIKAACNILFREDWGQVTVVIECLKEPLQLLKKSKLNNHSPFHLPTGIQAIILNNFHHIKSVAISIPVNASFVALTGNNAEGKTSLLQAIATAFYSKISIFPKENEVDAPLQVTENSNIIYIKSNEFGVLIVDKKMIAMGLHKYLHQYNNCLVAYGASRLQLQSSESQDVQNLKKSNVYNLFHNESTLLNIEHWFKIQKLKQDEARIQAVKNLLIELMPTIQDIQMGVRKTQLSDYAITYIENGKELLSEELSAGNKSILAMIGDMLIRLYDAQPEIIEPSQLIGIVLIDELELHLHPSWQKKLPQLLVKHFPLVQFIVSTHSPIVFLGMPPDTVLFNISKDETGETLIQKINIDLANVLPNQILTSSLFGMDDIRNIYNKSIQELSVETEPEIQKIQKRRCTF